MNDNGGWVVSEQVDMKLFDTCEVFWHDCHWVEAECHRDRQFHVARKMLLRHGDKGRLTFEKGVRMDMVRVRYDLSTDGCGTPPLNPYVTL